MKKSSLSDRFHYNFPFDFPFVSKECPSLYLGKLKGVETYFSAKIKKTLIWFPAFVS